MEKEDRAAYLLELAPPLGEDDDLVVEHLPGGILEAELDDVDGGLPGVGHVPGQPAELLHARDQIGTAGMGQEDGREREVKLTMVGSWSVASEGMVK
jgi:hypothetical protein